MSKSLLLLLKESSLALLKYGLSGPYSCWLPRQRSLPAFLSWLWLRTLTPLSSLLAFKLLLTLIVMSLNIRILIFILVSALSIPVPLFPLAPSPCRMRRSRIQVNRWWENHVFKGKRSRPLSHLLISLFKISCSLSSQQVTKAMQKYFLLLYNNLGFFRVHSERVTLARVAMTKYRICCVIVI